MTECERIIRKGIIPEDFLKEEERDGFVVTEKRKKIWAVELDLLFEIIRICEKHHIQYFLAGGNILGAVRHKGFIPWDDDIDVAIFRKDYDKFCEVCPSEVKEPYFFQTTLTENGCWFNTARLCNSNTTGIRRALAGRTDANKGIFVDILPIDAVSDNRHRQNLIFRRVHVRTVIADAYCFNMNSHPVTRFINWFLHLRLIPFDIKKWYRQTNRIAASVPWEKANRIGFVMWTPYRHDRVTWEKSDYDSTVELPFEFTKIKVPSGYERVLRVMYGDYMKFPPVESRGSWHQFIFEPDMPYEEYYKKYGQ